MTKKVAVNKKNVIIALVVIAVVALIYWAYASRVTPQEVVKEQENAVMVYHNNTIKEEVHGKLVWQCYAETMTVDQATQLFTMENVKGTFYREDGTSIELVAPKAVYNQETKNIELTDGVEAKSSDELKFKTNKVVWDGKNAVLTCEGNVDISKPGLRATGDKAESKDAFKNFKLMGNAHIIKGDN